MPTGPVAVGGEPFLVDIPGKMIDYVPDVAANLNIDVPGQYYELLDRIYVFIPTQASRTNSNLQVPDPADGPILEAYARAIAVVMLVYMANPTPADASSEMARDFTAAAYEIYRPYISRQAAGGYHTEMRSGILIVPRISNGTRNDNAATVLDCGWLDQIDVNADGSIHEEWNEFSPGYAEMINVTGAWQVDQIYEESGACS